MGKAEIWESFSICMLESIDWLTDPEGAERKIQYVIGAIDMANTLVKLIEEKE